MSYVGRPLGALIGVALALVMAIIAYTLFSGIPIIPAATSTAIASTVTGYNQELPFIGLLIAAGVALGALGRSRR